MVPLVVLGSPLTCRRQIKPFLAVCQSRMPCSNGIATVFPPWLTRAPGDFSPTFWRVVLHIGLARDQEKWIPVFRPITR